MQDPHYAAHATDSSPIGTVPPTPVELAHQAVARMIVAAALGIPPESETPSAETTR